MKAQALQLLFGIALVFGVVPSALAQSTHDVGDVLRTAAARVPELPSIVVQQSMRPNQNSWSANSSILNIRVDVAGSPKEAEWKLDWSFVITSVVHDREEIFNGGALYVWERYGLRLSHQTGPYVIHITARGGDPRVGINEPLAMKVLEQTVRELESVAPKQEVLRARDVPPSDPLVRSWGPQSNFFQERNLEVIPWEDALFILTDRELQGGKQYQTRWLTIFCANGDSFLTLQPQLDAYAEFGKARSVDLTGFASE